MCPAPSHSAASPVELIASDDPGRQPEDGIALCLSGGGYRAMLFHCGSLIRLNELGFLHRLKRISSVSGGSITAGVLGMNWNNLEFDDQGTAGNLRQLLLPPIQRLASKTIDKHSIIGGIFSPWETISDMIANEYDKVLFNQATLENLPTDDQGPRFVINATNVQTGALFRFSRPYMADYKIGRILDPDFSLAKAVAASSAFPPVLSPATFDLSNYDFEPDPRVPLQTEPFTTEVVLSDGGVYDNLGLETAWKRYKNVLVSDAGGQMQPEEDPKSDWARHAYRVLSIIDNQVRALRKRQLIAAYKDQAEPHDGAYWGIRSNISHYGLDDSIDCPHDKSLALANTSTRLKRLKTEHQQKLINWGYAVCDAAVRKHFPPDQPPAPPPPSFPFDVGIG